MSFAEIETDKGHDAFLLDVPEFLDIAGAFLQLRSHRARPACYGDIEKDVSTTSLAVKCCGWATPAPARHGRIIVAITSWSRR